MQTNSFLLFIFSLLPGAGHMYIGLMKRGTEFMFMFFGITAFVILFRFPILLFLLPIIWCYSFFEVINLKRMQPEEIENFKHKSLFINEFTNTDLIKNNYAIIGTILIVIGVYSVFRNCFYGVFYNFMLNIPWLRSLFSNFPSIILAIILICLGLYIINSKESHDEVTKQNNINKSEEK